MLNFSKLSKPKIVTNDKRYGSGDLVEFIYINTNDLNELLLNSLKPDLIVTDRKISITTQYDKITIYSNEVIPENRLHSICIESSLYKDDNLISIFTPTYNIGPKILLTYESLLNQTYNNWEWIIVDDSNDNGKTLELLKCLELNDQRVHVYSFDKKTNGNIGESKYRAAMLCSGKVLCELDHDDILTEDCIDLINKAYLSNPDCGFYYSDCVEYNFDTHKCQDYGNYYGLGASHHYDTYYHGILMHAQTGSDITSKSLRHIVGVPNHIRAWRSDIYHEIGGHNRRMRIADDYELMIRTFLHTRYLKIPKLLYIQSWGGNSQDSGDNRRDIQWRVWEIANYYSNKITDRIHELGFDDPFKGIDPSAVCGSQVNDLPILNKILE